MPRIPRRRAAQAPAARRWVACRAALKSHAEAGLRVRVFAGDFVTTGLTTDLPWLGALDGVLLFVLKTVSGRLARFTEGDFSKAAAFVA